MNPSAIYSKSGKGVQEASGKTSLLKRGDRAVLSAIDGRATLAEVAQKVGKPFDGAFEQLIRQLDRDGFVREVAAAPAASTTGSRPTIPAPPRAAPRAPAGKAPPASGGGEDLDFTSIMPALKPGMSAPPPKSAADQAAAQRAREQESALHKARQEAEARAQAERERGRAEMEAKARAETEAKIRAETEKKVREEAEARLRAEADAKAKAAREAALRLAAEAKAKAEAEAKAKIEAERKAREEAERKAREEAEKARKEAEELRQRLEEERKAREEIERKRKEEEERRRKEEEERRAREEAERKAREEAERKAREEAERKRREEEERRHKEEEERRAREEAERKAREEAERKAREEAERKRKEEEKRRREEEEERARAAREEEERARAAREEEERARKSMEETKVRQATLAAAEPPPPAPPAEPPAAPPASAADDGPGSLDSLMADLDSFSQREEDERAAREAAERKARDEKKRKAKEESDRRAKEEAEHERREAENRRRRQEEERRAQEEAERRMREAEEQRRMEAEERKRKAREALAAARQAAEAAPAPVEQHAPAASDDIGVTDEDLDMDDVRRDEAVVARESRKQQREREREAKQREREARERARAAALQPEPVKYSKPRRPRKWGKPVAITLFLLLVGAVGVLHVMPLPMQDYEQAASRALGRPVRIASGRLSLFTGVRLNLEGVRIGQDVRIATVHAYPEIGSLFDERKAFSRIELEGVTLPQAALDETLFARAKGDNFSVGRVVVKQLKLDGPVPLPAFEADAVFGPDGALRSATLRGPEELTVKLTPSGRNVEFDGTASSFTLPFGEDLHLSSFAMKGVATQHGMNITAWGGSILDGALSGTASVRWGGTWQVDGVLTVRGINAAVFAPALLSEGKAEGTGKFTMSGTEPAKLASGARIDGSFTVNKGVLGSFDLSRAIQTGGRQFGGRTQFVEMTGQGVYDRGAVALRNVVISAGALNAGASADIAKGGALSGRIVADVKTAGQSLRQTLNLGGTVTEPQVRD